MFEEVYDDYGNEIWCENPIGSNVFNYEKLEKDVLAIRWEADNNRLGASVGHKKSYKYWDHSVNVGTAYLTNPKVLQHEIGHVLGMQHEHQRPDRDSYLQFNCSNLQGFSDAWTAYKNAYPFTATQEKLCNDWDTALQFKFTGVYPFIKGKASPSEQVLVSSLYDSHSIMHYPSWGFTSGSCDEKYLLGKTRTIMTMEFHTCWTMAATRLWTSSG